MYSDSKNSSVLGKSSAPKEISQISPRKFSLLPAVLVLLLLVLGAIAGLLVRSQHKFALATTTRVLSVPSVAVVSPKPSLAASGMPLPAEIKAWVETPIFARSNGYLKRRYVDIGEDVVAGQLLAEIDTPELRQEYARAQGQLVQAQAALGTAKQYSDRWALLVKSGSVSVQENADKQADYSLKAAAVESARAEVRRLEELLSFNRVTAPFAGTITARNIDSGDLIVAAGGKELFHLAQTHKLRVFVQAPQGMARGFHSGQRAEITLQERPGRVFPAKVVRTAGVMASDSRTLLVELEVDNPKQDILAGSYAQARFTETKAEAALTLPGNTVLFGAEGPKVCVVKEDGKIEVRPVKLGRDFGQMIEVVTGVEAKDRVVVNPSESFEDGATVSISEPPTDSKKR